MSTQNDSRRIFSAAGNNGGGAVYSTIFRMMPGEIGSLQVNHPGSTTTTYTLEESNTPEEHCGDGPDYTSAVFNDADARDNDNVALAAAAKASAVVFTVDIESTAKLYRLKINTASGTGTITVDLMRRMA